MSLLLGNTIENKGDQIYMLVHEVFAHIFNGEVQNIIVCENYPTADYLAKCVYGDTAFAIGCLQYRCQVGDKYHDGQFWHVNEESGKEQAVPYEPTEEQKVEMLQIQNKALEDSNNELTLAMAEMIGGM